MEIFDENNNASIESNDDVDQFKELRARLIFYISKLLKRVRISLTINTEI